MNYHINSKIKIMLFFKSFFHVVLFTFFHIKQF
nr:MAG TPA: hypothetical protein [Microviridae sp.]